MLSNTAAIALCHVGSRALCSVSGRTSPTECSTSGRTSLTEYSTSGVLGGVSGSVFVAVKLVVVVVRVVIVVGNVIGDIGIMGKGGSGAIGVGRRGRAEVVVQVVVVGVVVGGVGVGGVGRAVIAVIGPGPFIFTLPSLVITVVTSGVGGALGPCSRS